ncbi:MAG: DNA/RNA helicase domain-containing protein [Bacteroidales bacterium]
MRECKSRTTEINNKSRMVAGYCWKWKSKKDPNAFDVIIPEHNFKMRWNLYKDGSSWIIAENSVNEIGCIHTCQGLELDYVGVIVGEDLRYKSDEIFTDVSRRDSNDHSVRGIKAILRKNQKEGIEIADRIIKNTYRTLMTRGLKGCYVYFCDKELEKYFKEKLKTSI